MFINGTTHDIVYEVGRSGMPVTQANLTSWGSMSGWAQNSNTGRVILVLCTEGGAELTVSTHSKCEGLVVVWRDAAARTVEAFHERYDFGSESNTTRTGDLRPDLTGEGVEYA